MPQQTDQMQQIAVVNIGTCKRGDAVQYQYVVNYRTVRLPVGRPVLYEPALASHLIEIYGKDSRGGDRGLRLVNLDTGEVQGEPGRKITFETIRVSGGEFDTTVPSHQRADGLPPLMENWTPPAIRDWANKNGMRAALRGVANVGAMTMVERLRAFIKLSNAPDMTASQDADEAAADGGAETVIGDGSGP